MAAYVYARGLRTRGKYTDQFKREVVRLATAPGNSLAGVAAELGVDRSVFADRVKKVKVGRYEAAPGKPLKSATQAENEQLRRELARVKMERDIPIRALGCFAKAPT